MKLPFSAVAVVAVSFVAGCAGTSEPQEEQVRHAVGSDAPTAEASGFFRLVCPWGTFYSFCSEGDQKAASENCTVEDCSRVSTQCNSFLREDTYSCGGEIIIRSYGDSECGARYEEQTILE